MKPIFVVIDGIDGCGKTTQVCKLGNFFSGCNILHRITKEPGGTDVGSVLRSILISKKYNMEPETELLLYSADRIEHQKKVILPNLRDGINIISDRFISSTYAYQIFGRSVDKKILDLLFDVTVLTYPDIIFFIDIDLNTALERARKRLVQNNLIDDEGKFESLSLDFFKRVRDGFLWYAKNYKNVVIIDGERSADEIFEDIKNTVMDILK